MSSLAISLLILAVAAVLAVVAVNVVQAMKRRKRLEAARPKPVEDQPAPQLMQEAGQASGPDQGNGPGRGGGAGAVAGTTGSVRDGAVAIPSVGGERAAVERGGARASIRTRQEPRLGDVEAAGHEPEPAFAPDAADVIPPRAGVANGAQAGDAAATAVARAPAAATPAAAGVEARSAHLSPLCDCIVTLPLDSPVGGERLLALTQGVRRAGAKPILVEGVPAADDRDDSLPLNPANAYRALRFGVLMANRHGPLNAMEYSEFVSAVQGIADHLSALADTPDMADVIARARDLDATCAQLDAQIGLNVDSPEPLGPPQLDALASRVGLVDRGGHRHARLGPNGELVFTMTLDNSPQRLGFLLDVPRTARSLDGWAEMVGCAREVAATLSGRVVDDNGRPISDNELATIARQLSQRYDSLESIGLPAGSALALRVFN